LFIGNITALYQQSFKRMLAFSSISHAGYLLFAIVALGVASSNSVFVYAYSIFNSFNHSLRQLDIGAATKRKR
jgi:NADH:ubiquinone oxidoreductase subunit 2 (subunit N)